MPTLLSPPSVDRALDCGPTPARRSTTPRLAATLFAVAQLVAPAWAFFPGQVAVTGNFSEFAAGPAADGGYRLAWVVAEPPDFQFVLRSQRVSAAGFPFGTSETELPVPNSARVDSVVQAPSGAWGVFWTQPSGADQLGVGGALFGPDGALVRQFVLSDPIPDPGGLVISYDPIGVALGDDGYAIALTVGIQEDPVHDPLTPTETRAYLIRVDASGNQQGAPVRVQETAAKFQAATSLAVGGGHLAVGLVARDTGSPETQLSVRLFDSSLVPTSGEIEVSSPPAAALESGLRVAVGEEGDFLAVWGRAVATEKAVMVRGFRADATPWAAEAPIDQPAVERGLADLAVTAAGEVWVSWVETPAVGGTSSIAARPFGLDGQPRAESRAIAPFGGGAGPTLTGGADGALLAWRPAVGSPLVAGTVLGEAGETGVPPTDLALEGPGLPGFRSWVRIIDSSAGVRWGTSVEPCLGEALCAAGAVPDRAEAIVRVVGPKPNGRLWPTLVKLSTSTIEIWIEQTSSRQVRFYRLPGAANPASGTLPGLFDPVGFAP